MWIVGSYSVYHHQPPHVLPRRGDAGYSDPCFILDRCPSPQADGHHFSQIYLSLFLISVSLFLFSHNLLSSVQSNLDVAADVLFADRFVETCFAESGVYMRVHTRENHLYTILVAHFA